MNRVLQRKDLWVKSIKIALAAFFAIAAAGVLGLKYSATAGIITVLSIQNTKRETFRSAANRALAFLCALLLSAGAFRLLGYTLPAFGVYLFVFALLCLNMGWAEAIAMDSVLITHFLSEKSMSPALLGNEAGLFLIGTGIGILVNLHLHRKEQEFDRLADEVDRQIKGILHRMSEWLLKEDKSGYNAGCFDKLSQAIEEAKLCAAANYNNQLFAKDTRELRYIRMREQQSVVLQGIYENIKSISYLPSQANQVADLLAEIEQGYHKDNTVEGLLEKLEKEGLATKSYGGAVLNESTSIDMPFNVRKKANVSDWNIICSGGNLREGYLALVGPKTAEGFSSFNADKAFFSCKGIDMEKGITDGNEMFSQTKQVMMHSAREAILAVDSSKFDRTAFSKLCNVEDMDTIITDKKPENRWMSFFEKNGIKCIYPEG